MINLHERMLPTLAGVEPATSWSPVGRRIQMSHRSRLSFSISPCYAVLIKMPCTLLIISQSDYLIQVVDTNLHTMINSADPDQKATDLELLCLQRQGMSEFSRTGVNIPRPITRYIRSPNTVSQGIISYQRRAGLNQPPAGVILEGNLEKMSP